MMKKNISIKLLKILKKLKLNKVDIIIFPEMVFSESILLEVKKYLNENKGNFALIISGSIWKDRKNQCVVISGDGIELTRQLKFNPYHATTDFHNAGNNEDIYVSSKNKIINILDIENVGRFATPICADFISEGYYLELQKVGVNLSFVPAYTPSLHNFKTNASLLGTTNLGSSFICNCCVPVTNNQNGTKKTGSSEVSYAFVPLKKKILFGCNIMKSCIPDKEICNCDSKSMCYFLVNFSKRGCEYKQAKV